VRGGVNPRDPEARFTRKRDKTYFGYKAHLAVDEESGLVRQAEMTPANVHDSRLGEALIQGDEQGFFADRAYDSQALRETLERRGLVDGIAWKVKHARYPLEAWQRLHNAWTGSVRSAVERAFATMKRWYGMGRIRAQRLPSATRCNGDEHEADARADARGLEGAPQTLPPAPRHATAPQDRPKIVAAQPPSRATIQSQRNQPVLQSSLSKILPVNANAGQPASPARTRPSLTLNRGR
jgi:IS5 family transposase